MNACMANFYTLLDLPYHVCLYIKAARAKKREVSSANALTDFTDNGISSR
jgi:hypothetical protein